MNGAEAIVKCLEEEKVEYIFGYPGAVVVPLYEAIRNSKINHILVRQEQAAGHIASGYARVNRSVGVCLATSGPGATNLITALATAYMDSIPLVAFTGQIESTLIGKDIFQEADIVGATSSFTKHNYLVKDVNDLPRIIKEAFYISNSGRKGPVLIDIPVDIQKQTINEFEYPKEVSIRGYKPTVEGHKLQIKKAADRIQRSKRPLICVGGGITSSNSEQELLDFVNKSRIPLVHTLMAKDAISCTSPYYVGFIGIHGMIKANKAVKEADLIILIGTRVADRSTGGSKFAENADLIHIDIDPAEIGKNLGTLIPLVGDSKNILPSLKDEINPLDTSDWIKEIKSFDKANSEEIYENTVYPKYSLELLSKMIAKDAIVTADVGQNQIWTAHHFKVEGERRFITSGGLGTMGYSLPASIGAKFANRNRQVIAVVGDGGFQMTMQELGTIAANNLKIIILLFNNSVLGMVKEIQNKIYGTPFGIDLTGNPDFIKLSEAYGIKSIRVQYNCDLEAAFTQAINENGPFLIECTVSENQSTL